LADCFESVTRLQIFVDNLLTAKLHGSRVLEGFLLVKHSVHCLHGYVTNNALHSIHKMGTGAEVKHSYRRLMALAMLVLALHAATLAQDFTLKFHAEIPFSFYAGSKMLPPGIYTLAVNRESHNVAIFQSNNTGVGTFLLASPGDGSNDRRSVLIFRTDGVSYVLQKLSGPDVGLGFNTEKGLSHLAEDRQDNATRVVIAQVGK